MRRSYIYSLIGLGLILLYLWITSLRPVPPEKEVHGGIDCSGSANKAIYIRVCIQLCSRLNPSADHLTLYRVERKTQEFFDNPPYSSWEQFQGMLVFNLKDPPSNDGTHPRTFWEQIVSRVEHSQKEVHIFFFTDGDNDEQDAGSGQKIKLLADKLSRNPHIRSVVLLGVRRENREKLRQQFSSFGNRLSIFGVSELKDTDALWHAINR